MMRPFEFLYKDGYFSDNPRPVVLQGLEMVP
jgi:hypothetical protein